jgi:precorrin-3B synthase
MTPHESPVSADLVKGWCPGALRPMESGDGLLVRLRVTGGILTFEKARAIAQASLKYGSGLLDLSARGNLQIRGVTPTKWPELIHDLTAYGLIDQDAEAESVRNVIASPLAGLDPAAIIDVRPLTVALENTLIVDGKLHALPPKFGFSIDDGGSLGLNGFHADINLEAVIHEGQPKIGLRLGSANVLAIVERDDSISASTQLARFFISQTSSESSHPLKRMNDLLLKRDAGEILTALGFGPIVNSPKRPTTPPPLGLMPLGDKTVLGVAAPFGRWHANDILLLASSTKHASYAELRLTPWRAILIPFDKPEAAQTQMDLLSPRFILHANDPRLAVAACSGMPACRNATTETHDDALSFASLFASDPWSGIRLHVSGCEKGCAKPSPTHAVLIAKNGKYNLVTQGKSSDHPTLIGLDQQAANRALIDLKNGGRI